VARQHPSLARATAARLVLSHTNDAVVRIGVSSLRGFALHSPPPLPSAVALSFLFSGKGLGRSSRFLRWPLLVCLLLFLTFFFYNCVDINSCFFFLLFLCCSSSPLSSTVTNGRFVQVPVNRLRYGIRSARGHGCSGQVRLATPVPFFLNGLTWGGPESSRCGDDTGCFDYSLRLFSRICDLRACACVFVDREVEGRTRVRIVTSLC
jgi:hypothetical protein